MANLFLYYYKKNWHFQIKKRGQRKNRTFSNITRFVQNRCTFINKKIENDYNDVYLDEMKPKKKMETVVRFYFMTLQ